MLTLSQLNLIYLPVLLPSLPVLHISPAYILPPTWSGPNTLLSVCGCVVLSRHSYHNLLAFIIYCCISHAWAKYICFGSCTLLNRNEDSEWNRNRNPEWRLIWFDLNWIEFIWTEWWSGTSTHICVYVKSNWLIWVNQPRALCTHVTYKCDSPAACVYIYSFVIFICFIPVFVFIHFIRFSSGFSVHLIDPETSNERICDSWTWAGSMGRGSTGEGGSTGRGKLDLARK